MRKIFVIYFLVALLATGTGNPTGCETESCDEKFKGQGNGQSSEDGIINRGGGGGTVGETLPTGAGTTPESSVNTIYTGGSVVNRGGDLGTPGTTMATTGSTKNALQTQGTEPSRKQRRHLRVRSPF